MRRGPVRSQPPHARCSSPCGSVENRRNLSPYRVSNPFGHERIRAHMSGYAARRPRARRHRSIRGIRGIRGIRALDEARAGNDAQRQRLEQGTGNREQGIRNGRERDRERETEAARAESCRDARGCRARDRRVRRRAGPVRRLLSFPVPRSPFPVPCSLFSLITTARWSRQRIGHDGALVTTARWSTTGASLRVGVSSGVIAPRITLRIGRAAVHRARDRPRAPLDDVFAVEDLRGARGERRGEPDAVLAAPR